MENKTLQSLPKFTTKSLFDGTYMDKLETYISDHFAGRVSWIELKSDTENILGKREQKGIYILNERLIEKIETPDYAEIEKNISGLNKFAAENDIPVFMMLVPTSAEFYGNELPSYMPNLNQREFIDYVYDNVSDFITTIDVYPVLEANKDKYIFYRTDHHWTTEGAYYAYSAASSAMGYSAPDISDYTIEQVSNDFKGTFYSKSLYDGIDEDIMEYYHHKNNTIVNVEITKEFGKVPEIYDSMYFREYLDVKDKYSSFLGTNQPIVTLKTGNSGGKLLIIKDSYAHCYAPFLTENYSEITLLDLRYIQISYKSIIDVSNYDQVLFLYNASSFSTDPNVKKLNYN